MNAKIGFAIASHDKPAQLLRLVQRLIKLYDHPPIVCHHDFSKCSLDGFDFPKEVTFVQPHLVTRWGNISFVRATFAALRALYERVDSPDWFVLLSGTDYPVRPAHAVIDQLSASDVDVYMDHHLAEYPWTPDPSVTYAAHAFKSAAWIPLSYDRYVAIKLWLPWYSLSQKKLVKIYTGIIRSKLLVRLFTPFSETLKCYGGSSWYTGNRRAMERLLAQNKVNQSLFDHYSKKLAPDESIVQTILCNQPDLKIVNNNFRYVDWSMGGHHPKTLGTEDLHSILASGDHFARKFDLTKGSEIFDAIDAAVDAES